MVSWENQILIQWEWQVTFPRKLIRKSVWTLQFIYYSLHFCLPIVNDNAINVHCAHQRVLHWVFIFKSWYPDFELPVFSVWKCDHMNYKFCTTWLKCLLRFYVTFPKIKITYLYYTEKINISSATHWIY